MRFSGSLVVLTLLLPEVAGAQSVKAADFTGTWVMGGPGGGYDTLVIRPDSTYRWGATAVRSDSQYTRWNYIKGDTISFQADGACIQRDGRNGL